MAEAGEFIPVGKISGVFGVRGSVKVFSYTEPRDNILRYKPLFLKRQGQWIEIDISGGQLQGKAVVMSIRNVTDRDQALPLIGGELAIRREQLKATDQDEFYWADLIGLSVINAEDVVLGKVDHLLETGANDVLVVMQDGTKAQHLIPFVMDEVVLNVDLANQQIRVEWQSDYL
ncbi:ribosome maturation factor RimM [Methylophaga sp. OBS3]|uniref:ribosome maturation factor RimM n=1 Tax=Methylophaga sp. OBS3 TaxID=2991934 RepID=UPI00225636DA|nr:ribosome maturation factor RimM [Methylophaga sp. OBS3]MCX4190298.1 ribosome maturation factor RimM [Methylophaga sp. OBS3]